MNKNAGSDDAELNTALAVLIANTRTQKRPQSLTKIAKSLIVGISRLGSVKAVAERIVLSPNMLRLFLSVLKLTPAVQDRFEKRELDSVDAAAQLARLPVPDQETVANALADKIVDTSDVRAISQLRKVQPTATIQQLMEAVLNSKTKHHYIIDYLVRGNRSGSEIRTALGRFVDPGSIVDLTVDGAIARVTLLPTGRKQLAKAAKLFGVPIGDVLSKILVAA